jgi:hypothetical protein
MAPWGAEWAVAFKGGAEMYGTTTTWRKELLKAFADTGDDWKNIEAITLSSRELDRRFYDKGIPFTVWTTSKVYFPWRYDGLRGVAYVSRNPDGNPTYHIGG